MKSPYTGLQYSHGHIYTVAPLTLLNAGEKTENILIQTTSAQIVPLYDASTSASSGTGSRAGQRSFQEGLRK